VSDREPYDYDEVTSAEILRPLDPTEHNMERLNRIGRGAALGSLLRTALSEDVRTRFQSVLTQPSSRAQAQEAAEKGAPAAGG